MHVSYLTSGLNALQQDQQYLIKTFATIKSVISEGLYVDVQLDESIQGATILQKIPVLKHPYFNLPIRVGDKVFLTNVNHLLNDFFASGVFTKYVPSDSYVAIPATIQKDYKWTNHFTFKNPEGTFELVINDKERTIKADTIDENISFKSTTQEYLDNIKIETKQDYELAATNFKIEGKASGEIVTNASLTLESNQITCGSKAVTLGACLSELITILETAMTEILPTPAPGAPLTQKTISAAQTAQLTALKAKIMGVFQ